MWHKHRVMLIVLCQIRNDLMRCDDSTHTRHCQLNHLLQWLTICNFYIHTQKKVKWCVCCCVISIRCVEKWIAYYECGLFTIWKCKQLIFRNNTHKFARHFDRHDVPNEMSPTSRKWRGQIHLLLSIIGPYWHATAITWLCIKMCIDLWQLILSHFARKMWNSIHWVRLACNIRL